MPRDFDQGGTILDTWIRVVDDNRCALLQGFIDELQLPPLRTAIVSQQILRHDRMRGIEEFSAKSALARALQADQ